MKIGMMALVAATVVGGSIATSHAQTQLKSATGVPSVGAVQVPASSENSKTAAEPGTGGGSASVLAGKVTDSSVVQPGGSSSSKSRTD
jgi:hypothetical protein